MRLTPKEKAQELFDKYFEVTSNYYTAKDCALIAIDEMINVCYWNATKEFLLEVKKEIEAL